MIAIVGLLMLSVLASPASDLQRLRLSGGADPAQVAQILETGLAELNAQTRPQQCMDAFLAGELYRRAAAASPGQGYDEKALERFRSMRVDYRDLPTGVLGYIGEARVHMQNGDPAQALAVLAPLTDARGDSKTKRLAQLEALDALLLIDPERAMKEAHALGTPAHGFLAGAYAKRGDRDKALELVRSEAVVASMPNFQRLELIADLGALNDNERSAWAQVLAGVGRDEAALEVLDEAAPAPSARLYAALLQGAGRNAEAAKQWRRAIESDADPEVMLAYAACLELLIADDPSQTQPALDAYRRLIESQADDALRADALRRWVHLSGADGSREMLAAYEGLVSHDPYLRYVRAVTAGDTIEPAERMAELDAVITQTTDPAVRASAVLLQARIQTDPREAIAVLTKYWGELMSQPLVAGPAQRHRVKLWIELGMVDRAADELLLNTGTQQPQSLLMVGEALADRYVDGIEGDAQRRVLQLAIAAITATPDDKTTALAAARLMLRVDARADAVKVLRSLDFVEAKHVLAEALRAMGRSQEALDTLAGDDTAQGALQRGLCRLELGQENEALADIRDARRLSRAGSDSWWEATLELAATQLTMDDRQAAAEVLRVAEALYPVTGRPQLRTRLDSLNKELQE